MAEAYWTHCCSCPRLSCDVEILEDNADVLDHSAHTACHEERRPMDPNATWQMLCDSLRALNQHPDDEEIRANVIMLLETLTRWLRRGGFPPQLG